MCLQCLLVAGAGGLVILMQRASVIFCMQYMCILSGEFDVFIAVEFIL